MDWKHGYFAESGYTYGFYPETSPSRIRIASALKGFDAPAEKFRYVDLGCGQGFSLILIAAMYPDSEFVGIDFMPEHISHARRLAELASITNVSFVEGDFLELQDDHKRFGEFDYAVAHGISTWISPAVREAMFSLSSKLLKPGGLMYNSYNTYPGWLPVAPFQHLVSLLQSKYGGRQALQTAQQHFSSLNESGSALFSLLPTLKGRLENMANQDVAYLVQEYNNKYWQPIYCAQMLDIARRHKLEFASTATLSELFDAAYPKGLLDLMNAEPDAILRESIRDLGLCQGFRRDIYIKGGRQNWSLEKSKVIANMRFLATGLMPIPNQNEKFKISGGALDLTGDRERFEAIINCFGVDGASIEQVCKKMKGESPAAVVQVASLMVHGGWLAIENVEVNSDPAKRLNRTLAAEVALGAPYKYIACPKLGAAYQFGDIDLLLIHAFDHGITSQKLGEKLFHFMISLNKRFVIDGVAVEEETKFKQECFGRAGKFISERLPKLRALQAI